MILDLGLKVVLLMMIEYSSTSIPDRMWSATHNNLNSSLELKEPTETRFSIWVQRDRSNPKDWVSQFQIIQHIESYITRPSIQSKIQNYQYKSYSSHSTCNKSSQLTCLSLETKLSSSECNRVDLSTLWGISLDLKMVTIFGFWRLQWRLSSQ